MTVNAAFTNVIGALPASTSGPDIRTAQVTGPYTLSKQLDETASDGTELTPETTTAGLWRLKVPASNAGVYWWAAQTNAGGANPVVTATTAVWLDPGESEVVFVPMGWKIIVKAALP